MTFIGGGAFGDISSADNLSRRALTLLDSPCANLVFCGLATTFLPMQELYKAASIMASQVKHVRSYSASPDELMLRNAPQLTIVMWSDGQLPGPIE